MKKENKKIVLSFISGAIIFGSIGVGAATYFGADQIKFTPTNESWEVDNAQDAMNELYEISTEANSKTLKRIFIIKTYWNASPLDINIADYYSGDLTKLTTENFAVNVINYNSYDGVEHTLNLSYNPSTGILTIPPTALWSATSKYGYINVEVYLFVVG